MCGIFGIYGAENAAALTHLGLYSLQHRGQESSGIVAVDREQGARAIKRMGLVSDAFAVSDVQTLRGDIAIGHTRTAPPALPPSRTLSPCSRGFATGTSASPTTET
jgi:Glutamine phosphoribosylpyrophosphate amidotransferase